MFAGCCKFSGLVYLNEDGTANNEAWETLKLQALLAAKPPHDTESEKYKRAKAAVEGRYGPLPGCRCGCHKPSRAVFC